MVNTRLGAAELSIENITLDFESESAVERVAPRIKADGEETGQSISPQIVCEFLRHSLFS